MASLTGTKIKDTYDGLLKTTDNGGLGASAKQITDGLGNSSPLYVGTGENVGLNVSPTRGTFHIHSPSSTSNYIHITDSGTGTTSSDGFSIGRSSGKSVIWSRENCDLLIATDNNERMRITSGGYLKASNSGSYLDASALVHEINQSGENLNTIITRSTATSPYGISMRFTSTPNNTSNNFFEALDGTATRIVIWSNGNVENYNNSYGAISDAKLKENITDASPKLDDLMQVQVRNYNLIGDDKKQLGVVAQELETVFPAMIDESPDFEEREVELRDENGNIVYETEQVLVSEAIAEELDADGNVITPAQEAVYETVTTDVPVMTTERVDLGTTTKSVKYSVFVPMLIKAIQELKAEVDALKGA